MTDKLEPCPFCGGEARIADTGDMAWVKCLDSKCPGSGATEPSVEAAIKNWNTRYKRTCKWWLEDYHDEANNTWTTECGERFCYGEYGHPNCCPYCGAEIVDGD